MLILFADLDFRDLVLDQKLLPYPLLQLRVPLDFTKQAFSFFSTRTASLHKVTPVCPRVVPESAHSYKKLLMFFSFGLEVAIFRSIVG